MKKSILFLCTIFLSSFMYGQSVIKTQTGLDQYDFLSTHQIVDLHFYLFDDGYHSFEHNPIHHYNNNDVPAEPIMYHSGPYKWEEPQGLSVAGDDVDQGSPNPQIDNYQFKNMVEVKTSWNVVYDQMDYYILMFENLNDMTSGCVEFHFSNTELNILESDILDHYNNDWVSNRSLEVSEYLGEGFTHKYVWNFDNLAVNEQRFVYIPATCLVGLTPNMKTRGVIKTSCGQDIPYYPYNDGNLNGVNTSNYFTSNKQIVGFPHDPNGIETDPYDLTVFDDEQTVEYTVYFQNEGTAPVVDVLLDLAIGCASNGQGIMACPPGLVYDVTYVSSSDPCSIVQAGSTGEVDITFPNINMPGLNQPNPPNYFETYGWVKLNVCFELEYAALSGVPSEVDIYFDYLPPVKGYSFMPRLNPNHMQSLCATVGNGAGNKQKGSTLFESVSPSISPNPTMGDIVLNMNNNESNIRTIRIMDYSGRLVQAFDSNEEKLNIDIRNETSGIYFIQVIEHGHRIFEDKIIKL